MTPTLGLASRTGPCYVCGTATGWRRIGPNDVSVCPRCGFGRLVDGPQAGDYWSRQDDLHGELTEEYWTTARTRVFTAALQRLEREVSGRRLLDLGGGVGHFARCALEAGWDAYSVDVSPTASAAAAARIGPERALHHLPASLLGTFDAVTAWCVAAHVDDPRRLLADAQKALRPGGRLFLTTPNFRFQAGYARVLAATGRTLDFAAHDHVGHFTPQSLQLLLRQAGLEPPSFAYVGVTEDCLLDRRLATILVPAKRAWNRAAVWLAALRVPLLSSELQVLAAKASR